MHPSHLLHNHQLSIFFHAKHASGSSQVIKVKVLTPMGVFVWLFERLTLFVFCSLGLGIPITALFSCDGEWINTWPENNPLSMEDTDHLLSFHERSKHTKMIFIWSFKGGAGKFTWDNRVIQHIGRYGGLISNNLGFMFLMYKQSSHLVQAKASNYVEKRPAREQQRSWTCIMHK